MLSCIPARKASPHSPKSDNSSPKSFKLTHYCNYKSNHSEQWTKVFKYKFKILNVKKTNLRPITSKNTTLYKDKSSKEIICYNKFKRKGWSLNNSLMNSKNSKPPSFSTSNKPSKPESTFKTFYNKKIRKFSSFANRLRIFTNSLGNIISWGLNSTSCKCNTKNCLGKALKWEKLWPISGRSRKLSTIMSTKFLVCLRPQTATIVIIKT